VLLTVTKVYDLLECGTICIGHEYVDIRYLITASSLARLMPTDTDTDGGSKEEEVGSGRGGAEAVVAGERERGATVSTTTGTEDDSGAASGGGRAYSSYSMSNPPRKKSRTSRKPKDMPKHPSNSYNCYFRDQRIKILKEREEALRNGTDKDQPELFQKMSKIVAERWKSITPEELEKYKEEAQANSQRYREEVR